MSVGDKSKLLRYRRELRQIERKLRGARRRPFQVQARADLSKQKQRLKRRIHKLEEKLKPEETT